jgi:RND family efflux transporter MFP subunit
MGPAMVVVAPVQKRPLELTQPLVASVEAVTRSAIASEQAGLVASREFDEGQVVQKNAVLATLNVDLLKAEHQAAHAAVGAAEASLAKAVSEVENARRNLDRIKKMLEGSGASQKEYDDALTAHQVAVAAQTVARATIDQRKAEVNRLALMLDKSVIRAPFKGIVARRHVEVGQWIERGAAVAEIVTMEELFVRANVPEDVIAQVKEGNTATVTFDALGGRAIAGKVAQVLPEGDRASRTIPVKILVPNADLAIRPGFFARVVLTAQGEPALTVPADAIVSRGTEAHVVVVRDGRAAVVPVTRLSASGAMLAVRGELREGEAVVIRGNEQLRGGEGVMVVNAPPATGPGPMSP